MMMEIVHLPHLRRTDAHTTRHVFETKSVSGLKLTVMITYSGMNHIQVIQGTLVEL